MTQVHAVYNPTFSRMVKVISSFLPLTVPNLEHDYYIEKVTLFTAIPTSTDSILYTLLTAYIFSVYLFQRLNCQVAILWRCCPSSAS